MGDVRTVAARVPLPYRPTTSTPAVRQPWHGQHERLQHTPRKKKTGATPTLLGCCTAVPSVVGSATPPTDLPASAERLPIRNVAESSSAPLRYPVARLPFRPPPGIKYTDLPKNTTTDAIVDEHNITADIVEEEPAPEIDEAAQIGPHPSFPISQPTPLSQMLPGSACDG